jgi:DNA polymerase-3 subunit beta
MNITCNATALAAELRLLTKIAPTKPSIPILSHVLLRAEDQLYLSATDLEVALSTSCSATIHEAGDVALPAHTLLSILEQLPDGDVNIANGQITSGGFRSKISALPTVDFPPLPAAEGEATPLPALQRLIERVSYAISEKAQKYVMDGALLSLTGNVIAMVATDAKRLSIATASRMPGPDYEVILPSKTLDMLAAQTGEVAFSRSDRHLFFQYGKRLLISRMLDGKFPNYQRIIPKSNDQTVTVDRAGLAAVLRRVGLVAESVYLTFSTNELALTSRSAEIGDADETIAVRYNGPTIKLCVNWKFVLDFLERAVEPSVTIAIKDSKSPLLMTDGADFINVVMVMQS